jgi:hypothetical protein
MRREPENRSFEMGHYKPVYDESEILMAEAESLRKDAERYRCLQKLTPYKFKKIQDASISDTGDTIYFHKDRFDAAIDSIRAAG